MTESEKQELRVKVAELCPLVIMRNTNGAWYYSRGCGWWKCFNNDPLEDLNACAEFEKCRELRARGLFIYVANLISILKQDNQVGVDALDQEDWARCCTFATATQRCKAFVNTVEGKS